MRRSSPAGSSAECGALGYVLRAPDLKGWRSDWCDYTTKGGACELAARPGAASRATGPSASRLQNLGVGADTSRTSGAHHSVASAGERRTAASAAYPRLSG